MATEGPDSLELTCGYVPFVVKSGFGPSGFQWFVWLAGQVHCGSGSFGVTQAASERSRNTSKPS
ncbi:hypothetical protein N9189_04215, partial [Pirellulaceae bacterium]|nr:hypothetical protein [Pirellulaceae bacterium]